VLTLPTPPQGFLFAALARLKGYASLVEYKSAVGSIPVETLARLLGQDDPKISGAPAIGEWRADPKGMCATTSCRDGEERYLTLTQMSLASGTY
jgi:sugar phosphate permease